MIGFFFYLTIVLFILVCLFMILLILIQKGRGGGLASAFGGAGGNTAFGSKTGDVLTWATSIVFGIFLVLAVALNLFADARNSAGLAAAQPGGATESVEVPLRETPPGTQPAIAPTTLPAPNTVPAAAPSTGPAT